MLHELIQSYFETLYSSYETDIKISKSFKGNELYGEVYYYSLVKLLKILNLTSEDHFLDIGSGLGKVIFQLFLTTPVASVTGIEINHQRYSIACNIQDKLREQLPDLFNTPKKLKIIHGDFLSHAFDNTTIAYICSTILSYDLLNAIGKKLNSISSIKKIISFRKLPHLEKFKLTKKIFLHCSWDNVACYIYSRKNVHE